MSLRVRCTKCQTAFLAPGEEPGTTIECPKCGARHRLPEPRASHATSRPPVAMSDPGEAGTVFVPSIESREQTSRRRWRIALLCLAILLAGGVAALGLRPWYRPSTTDPVERVAKSYLDALIKGDAPSQRALRARAKIKSSTLALPRGRHCYALELRADSASLTPEGLSSATASPR